MLANLTIILHLKGLILKILDQHRLTTFPNGTQELRNARTDNYACHSLMALRVTILYVKWNPTLHNCACAKQSVCTRMRVTIVLFILCTDTGKFHAGVSLLEFIERQVAAKQTQKHLIHRQNK